ncbi:MAG: alpha/beta hydrolase-fold protein [Leptospiraceae bacterium]|nr:alpha/beta hydrolase-fold protein [Leptospiraceae bacterium]
MQFESLNLPLKNLLFPAKNKVSPLLVVMHGLGDEMYSYQDFPRYLLQDQIHTLLLNAPEPYYMGWKWYDIDGDQEIGLSNSRNLIEQSVEIIQKTFSIPKNWIFLSGFSQGGVVSLYTGLRSKEPYAGLICLSGYLFGNPEDFTEESKNSSIFMAHGQFDDLIPISITRKHYQLLKQYGYNVHWEEYPIAHTICLEELESLKQWLTYRIKEIL